MGERPAAARVDVQQRVERAETDSTDGEHHDGEPDQHNPSDRAGSDKYRGDDRGRRDDEAAQPAIEILMSLVISASRVAVHVLLLLYNYTTVNRITRRAYATAPTPSG